MRHTQLLKQTTSLALTNKIAKYRPQLVDLTPSNYSSEKSIGDKDAPGNTGFGFASMTKPASSYYGSAHSRSKSHDTGAQGTSGTQKSRHFASGNNFHSRVANSPTLKKTAMVGASRHAGAVRNSTRETPRTSRHFAKASLGLVIIAGAIAWTTGESHTELGNSLPESLNRASVVPEPAFYFADKTDAFELNQNNGSIQLDSSIEGLTQKTGMLTLTTDAFPQDKSVVSLSASVPASVPASLSANFQSAANADKALTKTVSATTSTTTLKTAFLQEPEFDSSLPAIAAIPETAGNNPEKEAIQDITPSSAIASTETAASSAHRRSIVVKKGNTLSGILNANGMSMDRLTDLLQNDKVKDNLSNLNVNQLLEMTFTPDGRFKDLTTRVREDKRLNIELINDNFKITEIELPLIARQTIATGRIDQSLYLAAEKADLKQSTIMQLANIFQWELDFARDIRKDDRFSLVYEKLFREGEYVGDGNILAAEFVRGGKAHIAIRFTSDEGETGYYSPDGKSMRRTFMRHPVDVARITSKFNPNRLHPVLHQIRAHRGVDYGSPYGSPIYATGDGRVTFAGSKNAYGKTVILQHGEKFSTLYAHMSRISSKSKVGQRVLQGDVIGYVGNTGRVTGTHLHYEFRVNNIQIDPLKIELPAPKPIAAKYLDELKQLSGTMISLMQSSRPAQRSDDEYVAVSANQ